MAEAKQVLMPLGAHYKLTSALDPDSEDERSFMSGVPYATSDVGSLMFAIIYEQLTISFSATLVSRSMTNP